MKGEVFLNFAFLLVTLKLCRGLDMPAKVDHIVNFDFPQSPVDYIHRAGRTARAGLTGKVTSLLQKRDLVLGDRIEDALQHGRPLDDLSADRKQLPNIMRCAVSPIYT